MWVWGQRMCLSGEGAAVKVCAFGAGGVGGYFGGRLARSGVDVRLVARGQHLEALKTEGLEVRSVFGDFHVDVAATDDPAEVGVCDVVLFTVKSYDTAAAAEQLHPLIGPDTAVVSLQNGIDNEEKLAEVLGPEHVMGGVAYIFSNIAEPGVIEHAGGPSSLVFGELDGRDTPRGRRLLDACDAAGIDATLSPSIREVLWTKFAFICALSGVTASSQLPIGDIRSVAESRELFARLVDEAAALAAAEGIELAEELSNRHLELVDNLEPEGRSSLYHDLSHGRRLELEALLGAVVDRAQRREVAACASESVYAILRPWAVRNQPGA